MTNVSNRATRRVTQWLLAALLVRWPAVALELVTERKTPTVVVGCGESEAVHLAAADLIKDFQKITGRAPRSSAACSAPCVIIETRRDGRWEQFRVQSEGDELRITGSDDLGTIYGVYAFAEQYLGVDPVYFWAGREPARRKRLAWDSVAIESKPPTFRYRGWFINDEDLLTEWKEGGGKRFIDYPFYHQVTAAEVHERIFEAMLRLRYNLVIPASFTDIENPPEERMVQQATRRGLWITMHHVEPMGVSGFAFANFYKARGRQVPFSFFRFPQAFEEIWKHYANLWARYPNVVWQLGLRGIADRPVWVSDPDAPKTDEARGKLISSAMEKQWSIVRAVDPRPNPPATTTLWMEGAALNRQGFLKFPEGVGIIFSDNSPGWIWQSDFYETPRQPGRNYGVYYHHGLWGSGPHLVQAAAPWKTRAMLSVAVERGYTWYAMLNVANVREFVLGLDASARMLTDFASFDSDRWFRRWCQERFGAAAEEARRAYESFFASYVLDPKTGTPALLDGLALHQGERIAQALLKGQPASAPLDLIRQQLEALNLSIRLAEMARAKMSGAGREFFETNLLAQQRILCGILRWTEALALCAAAKDRAEVARHLQAARDGIAEIRSGQALCTRGPWKNWYRGDRKMNINRAEQMTMQLAEQYEK